MAHKNNIHVLIDSSFVMETLKCNLTLADFARVLGVAENQLTLVKTDCVLSEILKKMSLPGLRKKHAARYSDAVKFARPLESGYCYGHLRGYAAEIECLKTLLEWEPFEEWVVGSYDCFHQLNLKNAFPDLPILTVVDGELQFYAN